MSAKLKQQSPKKRLHKIRSHALEMEEPLNDLGDQMRALSLICDGLYFMHQEFEARALRAIAFSALRNADALKEKWNKVLEVGQNCSQQ